LLKFLLPWLLDLVTKPNEKMVTVKGVIRSYGAAVRRMEREQQRQAREAAKRFKEQQKLQAIEDTGKAVKDWMNYIDCIEYHESSHPYFLHLQAEFQGF